MGRKIAKGTIWSFIDKAMVFALQFIFVLLISRYILPNEYALVGVVSLIIAIAQIIIEGGFSKALIQSKELNDVDYSTIFIFNVVSSTLIYGLLFILSNQIEYIFNIKYISQLIRFSGISIIFNAIYAVPNTILIKNFEFKKISVINFATTIFSGFLGFYLVTIGWGIWSLVIFNLSRSMFLSIFVWFYVSWRPLIVFSKRSFSKMYQYGVNLMLTALMQLAVNNWINFVVIKKFGADQLGFFYRGSQFVDFAFSIFSSSTDSVLHPLLSNNQEDKKKIVKTAKNTLKFISAVSFPLFGALIIGADSLIRIILTDKWVGCVPIIQLMAIARLISLISNVNMNILYALGKSRIILKQQYLKLTVRFIIILTLINFGVWWIALAEIISTVLHFYINCTYSASYLKFGWWNQIKLLKMEFLSLMISVIMGYLIIYKINVESLILELILSFFSVVFLFYVILYFLEKKSFRRIFFQFKIMIR